MIEIPCVFSAIKNSYTSKFHRNQQDKPRSYATLDPLCLWILHHIPYRWNFSPRTYIHGDHESFRRILYFSVIRNFIIYTISNSFRVSYNEETRIIFAIVFQFYIILNVLRWNLAEVQVKLNSSTMNGCSELNQPPRPVMTCRVIKLLFSCCQVNSQ